MDPRALLSLAWICPSSATSAPSTCPRSARRAWSPRNVRPRSEGSRASVHADWVAGVVGETGQRGFRLRGGGVDHAADGGLGEAAARGGAREGVQAMDLAAEDDGAVAADEVEEFVALRALLFRRKLMPRGAGAVGDDGRVDDGKKCSAVRRAAAGSAGVKARASNATKPVGERKEAGRGGRISVSGTQTRAGKPLPRGPGLPVREFAAVAQNREALRGRDGGGVRSIRIRQRGFRARRRGRRPGVFGRCARRGRYDSGAESAMRRRRRRGGRGLRLGDARRGLRR